MVLNHNQDKAGTKYLTNCQELVDMMLEYLDGIKDAPNL
jgi:hypothetical protein